MHRLTTALDFMNNKFKIRTKYFSTLEKTDKYNNKLFGELENEDQQKIRNYNFFFNLLDSSYHYDINKRLEMSEILNRSSRLMNNYEFNNIIYNEFYSIFTNEKKHFSNFFNKSDTRGKHEEELIELIVVSDALPNSWQSIPALLQKYYDYNLGVTKESIENFLKNNRETINNKLTMLKKIFLRLVEENFFPKDKKIYNNYYLVYKFLIARLLHKFKDISLFNRHFPYIINIMNEKVFNVPINTHLKNWNLPTRNSNFQREMINLIDSIIENCYEQTKDKRFFHKHDIDRKLQEQGNICAMCKNEKQIYEGDHIIEWGVGGKTEYENLQVLCRPCHWMKTSKTR